MALVARLDPRRAAPAGALAYLVMFDGDQAAYAYASWRASRTRWSRSRSRKRVASAFLNAVFEIGGDLIERKVYEVGESGVAELVPRSDSTLWPIVPGAATRRGTGPTPR